MVLFLVFSDWYDTNNVMKFGVMMTRRWPGTAKWWYGAECPRSRNSSDS